MGSDEPETWRRIALLFDQAVSLSGEERAAFLDRVCADDDDLRQRVDGLLRSSDQASGFLSQPAPLTSGSMSDPVPLDAATEVIGPYRLVDRIGQGGMGEVWRAEQSGPLRRPVALKVIKSGMDTRQVVARFEAERQALAWLDHPAIARVYDAGATPRGRPYFVMELVEGEAITHYCDRERLTVQERLDLFIQVCEGVQHAHQRGIIHRDLKPSNILVAMEDGKPIPKIIDFGVAKATTAPLTDKPLRTELGMMIGTPEYMSPEQAEMTEAGVDTRTDIYALGVLLYELLTGTLPFDSRQMRDAGYDAIRKRIREEEPPRPSARVRSLGEGMTAVGERRRTQPARLVSRLQGELDWIVLRAMEKDRARRYGSPGELAADIGRSLRQEPVLAGPPGGLYRARKFMRRHWPGLVVSTAAVIGLLVFALTMSVQSVRIAKERDRADREAAASRRVTDYLVGLFRVSDPDVAQGATITAREILARGADSLGKDLDADPLIQARLLLTIGLVYQNLSLYEDAERSFQKSLQQRQRLLGPEHADTLTSMHALASIYEDEGNYDRAERLASETLGRRRRVLGEDNGDTLATACLLGRIYLDNGKPRDADVLLEQSLRARHASPEANDSVTLDTLVTLASSNMILGRYSIAERHAREALVRGLGRSGKEDSYTMNGRYFAGLTCFLQGKFEEARTLYGVGFETSGKLYGPEHSMTLQFQAGLAAASFFVGNRQEALAVTERVLEISSRAFGPDAWLTQQQYFGLGMMSLFEHRYLQAEDHLRQASDSWERTTGPNTYQTLWARTYLAVAALHNGKLENARRILEPVVTANRRVLGPEHPHTRASMRHLADVYAAENRDSEAEKLYMEALADAAPATWQDPQARGGALFGLAGLEARRGARAQALDRLRQAVALGFDDPLALSRDVRLRALRSHPTFAALAAGIEANSRRLPPSPTP